MKSAGVKKISIATVLLVVSLTASRQAPSQQPDPWAPMRFMIGTWHGSAKGQPGEGTVERKYEFVLANQFIEEHNTTTYPPQEKNKNGEVHRHRSFFSYDRKRKTLLLRQFHQESFVVTYVLNLAASAPDLLVFESESFENLDSAWKAKETYQILSKDEFIESFELAPPGKPFEVYSKSHFHRAK